MKNEMNPCMKQQLAHRTIREFDGRTLSEEEMQNLLAVIRQTASSVGLQSASFILLKDPAKKQALARICGQDYVARMPQLMIFLVDCWRNRQIAEARSGRPQPNSADMDRFFQGFTDACLAAQNLTTAVESMGLGAVYLGSILNDPDAVIELLHLPPLTFPVLGVGFGYPAQNPQFKPRMDMKLRCFTDEYVIQENYSEIFRDYDAEMQQYYDLRSPEKALEGFTSQVVMRLGQRNEKRSAILRSVAKQGFSVKEYIC